MKPGYKTTEFWIAVAGIALEATKTMPHSLSWPATALAIGYALARSIVKVLGGALGRDNVDTGSLDDDVDELLAALQPDLTEPPPPAQSPPLGVPAGTPPAPA